MSVSNASPAPLSRETDLDRLIDRLLLDLTRETDPLRLRAIGEEFTAAIITRNAMRTPAQVAYLERQRGLRA